MRGYLIRHLIAVVVVAGGLFSAMFIYPGDLDAGAVHGSEVHFISLVWGLYYGIGFEPAFIWYRIHGPYSLGFVDDLGMIFYPIFASALLYAAVLWLCRRPSSRRWFLVALGLTFLVIVPRPNLPMRDWWRLPLWINGAMSEPP